MAEDNDYSSINPLDAAAAKDGWPLVGIIALVMLATVVGIAVIGLIVNSLT
ncbi:MAG TPA: hypothetical protein VNO70_02585 [Blastocatellia bacterium]|nr:hypothetical protein [Blastocatellia bacterium]